MLRAQNPYWQPAIEDDPPPTPPRPSWRPRSLARALLTLGLLLLAGAVVNVAVAWVLSGAPDSWTPGGPVAVDVVAPFGDDPAARSAAGEALRAQLGAPPSWGPAAWAKQRRGLGWTQTDVVAGGFVPDLNWHGQRLDAGWPVRSMAWMTRSRSDDSGQRERRHSPSIEVPLHALMDSGWFDFHAAEARDRIPLTPVFPGFAINTICYSSLLALPLGVSLLRNRRGHPALPADGAARRGRGAGWLGAAILAVALAPGGVLAAMGSLFGAALLITIVASAALWFRLLATMLPGRNWAALLPVALTLGIVTQFAGVVVMGLIFSAFVYR